MIKTTQTKHLTQRRNETLLTLLETLPGALFVIDDDMTIVYANASAQTMLGTTQEALVGNSFWHSAPPLVSTALYQAVLKARQTRKLTDVEYRSPATQTWFHAQISPTGVGLAVFFQKNTEPTQCQDALCQSEQRYRDLLEHSAERVAMLTPEGLILEISQRPLADAQVLREEVIGKPLTAVPWWASVPHAQGQLCAAIEQARQGETVRFEARICPHSGRCLDLAVTLTPQCGTNQQVEYLICTGFDITRYKRVEEELHTVLDTLPQFVWVRQPDGSIAYSNRRSHDYARMMSERHPEDEWFPQLAPNDRQCIQGMWRTAPRTDITYDEAVSLQFVHPEDRERVLAIQRQGLEAGEPYEFEYRLRERQPGAYRWFLSRGVPLRNEEGQIVQWFGTCTDIHKQKQTEDALRQSQERVNHLMNSSVIGIFFAEGDVVVEGNHTFLRMTGYSRNDLSQRRLTWGRLALLGLKTSLTQQAHQELVVQQYATPFETELVCKDGSRLDVLMGGVAFHGEVLQGIGFVLDNSARKELERRKDTFISMANHELRTPLTAIKIQTQLLKKRLVRQGLHEAAAALSRVEEPLTLLERLVGDLLDVTRIQAGRLEYHWEPVDLDALLQDVTSTTQQMDPTHIIAVRGTISRLLLGDKDRLAQVFLNLISNAIKYAPDALLIDIEASASAETATVVVRDHGIGIPKELCEKIFERFYRVSNPSQLMVPGLGMGLCIVTEIVKQHGGTITVDSEVGKGSTFHVTLPLTRES
ncbi:PAS domain S-box protein [Ktedonobacter racemifer]|uniref:histidine kinase n=1 Tax=Ktedonobacter racemifer DSM 44963 TaxID=485913 RepID=D6TE83_KTERA|nr:PAS domain S-box protein [Ktedonobacter racemifer]EFH88456.1 PAS/PAC sensor signal transduction histidine kinase [Ktedonobacter racemifer DSM 44963]